MAFRVSEGRSPYFWEGHILCEGTYFSRNMPAANIPKIIRCMTMKFSPVDGMVKYMVALLLSW